MLGQYHLLFLLHDIWQGWQWLTHQLLLQEGGNGEEADSEEDVSWLPWTGHATTYPA